MDLFLQGQPLYFRKRDFTFIVKEIPEPLHIIFKSCVSQIKSLNIKTWIYFGDEKMGTGKWIGLAFLGGGLLILVVYGAYNLLREVSNIDPVTFTAVLAILFGIAVLIVSTAMDRKSEEEKKIRKEDLRP